MHAIKLDLKHGLVLVDLIPVVVSEKGVLAGPVEKLYSSPIQTDGGEYNAAY
jgi:hypothetical protein